MNKKKMMKLLINQINGFRRKNNNKRRKPQPQQEKDAEDLE